MRPKVFLTRKWPDIVEARLAETYELTRNTGDAPLDAAEISAALASCDAVCPTVTDTLDAGMLSGHKQARILANYGVGTDHIDLQAAHEGGMTVTNTPDCLTDATADLAMTLILMAARRAGEGEREVRSGAWSGWRPTHCLGRQVSGATLGIIGMGRIGHATALRAQAGFGMRVVFWNRSDLATPDLQAVRLKTIADVMRTADIVSLHLPGGPATRGIIGADELAALGPAGILINTARGDVVDQPALIRALETGQIAGAGLDVYDGEPSVPGSLRRLDRVVLLPHLGSATRETRIAMGMMVADNLDAFFDGRPVPHPVLG